MIYVGQQVEYVGPELKPPFPMFPNIKAFPQRNKVYVIRELRHAETDSCPCALLQGLCCGFTPKDNREYGIPQQWLRPVQKKTVENIMAVKAPKDSQKWDNRRRIKEKA